MQKVVLLPPLIEDYNKSMEVYAQELARAFKEQKLPIQTHLNFLHQVKTEPKDISPDFPVKLKTVLPDNLYFKYFVYPNKINWLPNSIVHITDHSYGHLLFANPQQKFVITCHDLTLLRFQKKIVKTDADQDRLNLFKYSISALKRAQAIIADSKATQNDLEMFLNIPKTKIKVIPLGVNYLYQHLNNNSEINELSNKYRLQNHFILLHVGNNAFYKNMSFLFKILYLLINKHQQKVKLMKIGADFTEFQKMMIRNLNLSANVLHLGEVPLKKQILFYNLADLLVYPSLNEGFGLPVLEAMACGTPVLTSNLGSLPSVVGKAGLLLEPKHHEEWANTIKDLINHPEKLNKMSELGLTRAKEFSWKNTANKTYEVYQQVINL
ncbi:MAG: glycosyltransferase family 4 protein [Candidatus Margulisbacteria bacterium]|nr:glycosyltransferase family 4 protein [Candidatus Margulisiibacteriota bacterium]